MLIYQRFIITINQFWGQELAYSVSSIEVSATCFKDQDGLAQIGGLPNAEMIYGLYIIILFPHNTKRPPLLINTSGSFYY